MKAKLNNYVIAHMTTEEFIKCLSVLKNLTKDEFAEIVERQKSVKLGLNLTECKNVKGYEESRILTVTSRVYHPDYIHTFHDYVKVAAYEDFKKLITEISNEKYIKPTVQYPLKWTR